MSKAIEEARKMAQKFAEKAALRPWCEYSIECEDCGHIGSYCCNIQYNQWFSERCTKEDEKECPRLGPPAAT